MTLLKELCFAILIALAIAGCKNSSGDAIDLLAYKDNIIDYGSLIDTNSYRMVKLEQTDNSIIGYIKKAALIKDRIVVFDEPANSVLIFDADGRFISRAGRKGRGPGEHMEAVNFTLDFDEDYIIISDNGASKQIFYDLNGRYVKEFHLRHGTAAYLNNEFVFAMCPDYTPRKYELVRVDSMNNILGGYYRRPRYVTKENAYYMPRTYFYQVDGKYYFIPLFKDELYSLDKEGIELKYRFGFGKKMLDYDKSQQSHEEGKLGHITNFTMNNRSDYFFNIWYGKGTWFEVYGNMDSGRIIATAKYIRMSPKLLIGTDIIGSHKEEFITAVAPAELFDGILPATNDDNPFLVFFRLNI